MQYYLELLNGPTSCKKVKCSSGFACKVHYQHCQWKDGNKYYRLFEKNALNEWFFFLRYMKCFRLWASNSKMHHRNWLSRGDSFVHGFQLSRWSEVHTQRAQVQQFTVQVAEGLCQCLWYTKGNNKLFKIFLLKIKNWNCLSRIDVNIWMEKCRLLGCTSEYDCYLRRPPVNCESEACKLEPQCLASEGIYIYMGEKRQLDLNSN